MPEDAELLRRYAAEKSEVAFAELVRRHLSPVYAYALRQVGGDAHLAEDVAQMVFTALARKAAALAGRQVLGGWLCRTTHFAARDIVRAERRRRAREQEAQTMHESSRDIGANLDWEKLHPMLAQTMGELNDEDRDAVWLRYFEGRSFAEVGARLRLTENAARMRVERALDKLNAVFARRGVTSTATALGVALANQASIAAPAGLASSVTGAALASAASTAGAGAWFTLMSMTKLQIGIAGVLAVAGTTGLVVRGGATTKLRAELTALRQQNRAMVALQAENARLARVVADAEAVRAQTVELERLRGEARMLRGKLQVTANVRVANAEAPLKTEAPYAGVFFEPVQVDVQPKPTFQARPTYPTELRKLGLGGSATIDLIVDAKGRVHNATVLNATHPAIGESALAAVRDWEFDPAQKQGEAVAMHLQETIRFRMESDTKASTKPADPSRANSRSSEFVPWF